MHARLPAPSLPLAAAALALFLPGCDAGTKTSQADSPGPSLVIVAPRMDHEYKAGEKVEMLLDLKNYTIGEAKKGADGKYAADTGQHVHVIVDNGAYDAKYDVSKAIPFDPKLMTEGTHVLRVFPSAGPADSKGARWHESRKNEGAFAWVRFHVVSDGGDLKGFDGTKPLLTYSRPKGEYKLSGPDKPLLFPLMVDFYVSNCTLSKDGYHVRATVDGKAQPDYTEWKPYTIEGDMAAGDHKVVLELLDSKGEPVEGPLNKTERTIKVTEK